MRKGILVSLLIIFAMYLYTVKAAYAQCESYPCVDSRYANYCTNIRINPTPIVGPQSVQTTLDPINNPEATLYSPNLSLTLNVSKDDRFCISKDPTGIAECEVPGTGAMYASSNNGVLNQTIPLTSNLNTRYSFGTAGIQTLYIKDSSEGIYCPVHYEVKLPQELPPTPTSPQPTPKPYSTCSISVSPSHISSEIAADKSQTINLTVKVSTAVVHSFTEEDLKFEKGKSGVYAIFKIKGERYNNEGILFSTFTPASTYVPQNYISFSHTFSLADKFRTVGVYPVEIEKILYHEKSRLLYSEPGCKSSFTVGEPPTTPTPILTNTPEEDSTENLASICEGLKDEDEINSCKACMSGEKFENGVTGAYTAIGCIPTDLSTFFQEYFFVTGLGFAGGIAFLLMLWGGFTIVISQGDPQKIQQGREIIISAGVGLLFIIFSVVILRIIGGDILKIPGFTGENGV